MKTFRFRIALVCSALAGTVLVAFAGTMWWMSAAERTRAFERQADEYARRLLRRLPVDIRPEDLDAHMEAATGEDGEQAMVIVMMNQPQHVVWCSEAAVPDGLNLSTRLPTADELARARPLPGPAGGMGTGILPSRPEARPEPRPPGLRQRIRPRVIEALPGLRFFDAPVNDEPWRFAAASHFRYTVFAGLPLAGLQAQKRQDALWLAAATGAGLLLVGGGAWWASRRMTQPLRRVADTAGTLHAGTLEKRIALTGREDAELRELITVLNGMMDRLQASFGQAVRFTADASHELQTPLAVMQATLDDALRHADADSPRTDTLQALAREVSRLKSITRSLLLLARADAGRLAAERTRFSLSVEMISLAEDAEILCQEAGLDFLADIEPDISVHADRGMIRQTAQNLLGNAVRYNRPAGRVLLRLARTGDGRAALSLTNTGPGIPPADQPRLFDRFFRGDRARGPAEGFGLGLNIAAELARANDGTVELVRSVADETTFALSLPAA